MTELPERAIARVRVLPDTMRDDAARMVSGYAGEDRAFDRLGAEELGEQDAADAADARGDYPTDDEARAIWAQHGL